MKNSVNLRQVIFKLGIKGMIPFFDDKTYLKMMFRCAFNRPLDLNNPRTFNEKIQWLKLYDRKPEYTRMVDKYEAKKYVSEVIGEEYIIPTLGVWNSFSEIDFDRLPDQFVLKCTHDSGGLVICRDKTQFDYNNARKKIEKSLKRNYYLCGREWPYKLVKPRIIAEQYMEDQSSELQDYKVHCFDGIPRIVLVCKNRFSDLGLTEDFFDTEWKHLDVQRKDHGNSCEALDRPKALTEMLQLASILSKGTKFLRTDFYEVGGKLYFGELTYYPASGFAGFDPDKWDEKLGNLIHIPGGV